MKVYEFLFCGCIHESSYATLSLHKTKAGAWKAMNKCLNDSFMEEYNERIMYGKHRSLIRRAWKFGQNQRWTVREFELLD